MARHPYGILILHGFLCTLDCLQPVAMPLAALGVPTRVPILRGHSTQSPVALRGVTWRDWVSDAKGALDDLAKEAERIIVIGHSMGGLVTVKLAAEHGENIDSIVLVAAAVQLRDVMAPGRPFRFVTKALMPLRRPVLKYIKVNLYPPAYADPDLAKYNTDYHWAPMDAVLSVLDFVEVGRRCLAHVSVPTLIIQSHNDSTLAPECANIIYAAIPTPPEQKRIVWFENTEHEMLTDCEAAAVVGNIVEFVRQRVGAK